MRGPIEKKLDRLFEEDDYAQPVSEMSRGNFQAFPEQSHEVVGNRNHHVVDTTLVTGLEAPCIDTCLLPEDSAWRAAAELTDLAVRSRRNSSPGFVYTSRTNRESYERRHGVEGSETEEDEDDEVYLEAAEEFSKSKRAGRGHQTASGEQPDNASTLVV